MMTDEVGDRLDSDGTVVVVKRQQEGGGRSVLVEQEGPETR